MELCFNVRTFFHECKLVYTMDFKVTPHMLRHTYITNLIYKGVDPKTVQYVTIHGQTCVQPLGQLK